MKRFSAWLSRVGARLRKSADPGNIHLYGGLLGLGLGLALQWGFPVALIVVSALVLVLGVVMEVV